MEEDKGILGNLEEEEAALVFDAFSIKDAHTIGLHLIEVAQLEHLSITVDIRVGKHQVYHYACEGTNEENDDWVVRKNNVTNHFGRSSYYISRMLLEKGTTITSGFGLSEDAYAPFGGSYPINVDGKGMVGTITVSGLLDHLDHEMVVNAIKWFLKK